MRDQVVKDFIKQQVKRYENRLTQVTRALSIFKQNRLDAEWEILNKGFINDSDRSYELMFHFKEIHYDFNILIEYHDDTFMYNVSITVYFQLDELDEKEVQIFEKEIEVSCEYISQFINDYKLEALKIASFPSSDLKQ